MSTALSIFGAAFGSFLVLDGAFGWGFAKVVRPAPKIEVRVSEIIIGILFVVLAILTLTGVIST
jgi:hypothetical protein